MRTGIHVGVDVLVNRLSTPWKNKFIIFGLLAGASFTGIIAALGANFVYELSGTSSTSEVLEIPIWIVYLAIPVGSGLMCFRFMRSGELPVHDHTHVEGLEQESTVNTEVRS